MSEIFYIYGLVDQRTDEIRYIGKSKNPKTRLVQHYHEAKKHPHTHRARWLKSLPQRPEIRILESITTEVREEWENIERFCED